MSIILFVIPLFTILSGILMYRFTGRRDIMKFDLIQFLYAFVISPVMFVWLKSFLFFLLRSELDLQLSVNELFLYDTILTLLFMYVYAFVVIHTLTKTFDLYRDRDPLYDIFEHTDFFHLWLSHFAVYVGAMVVLSFISMVNVFIPTQIEVAKTVVYFTAVIGSVAGVASLSAILLYESPDASFHRFMKLAFGSFFLLHAVVYFIRTPDFSGQYLGFWFVFPIFIVTTILSLFVEQTVEKKRFGFLPFSLNWRKPSRYASQMGRTVHRLITSRR